MDDLDCFDADLDVLGLTDRQLLDSWGVPTLTIVDTDSGFDSFQAYRANLAP